MDQLGQHGQHGQHGHQGRRTDEFGNPIADAYGNPVGEQGYGHETGVLGTGTGAGVGTGAGHTGGAFTHGSGGTAQMMHPEQHQQKGGILHRSGSSSSSSSEDDGMGGRRKKGLKQKIKEKLPGHQKTDEYGQPIQGQGHTATGAGYGGTGATTGYGGTTGTGHDTAGYRDPEKKGMMEKIKEKLPGHQKTDEYGQPIQGQGHATTGTGAGYGGTGAATGYGGTGAATGYGGTTGTGHDTAGYREPEKKGMMEKIKEKLPGGHQ